MTDDVLTIRLSWTLLSCEVLLNSRSLLLSASNCHSYRLLTSPLGNAPVQSHLNFEMPGVNWQFPNFSFQWPLGHVTCFWINRSLFLQWGKISFIAIVTWLMTSSPDVDMRDNFHAGVNATWYSVLFHHMLTKLLSIKNFSGAEHAGKVLIIIIILFLIIIIIIYFLQPELITQLCQFQNRALDLHELEPSLYSWFFRVSLLTRTLVFILSRC